MEGDKEKKSLYFKDPPVERTVTLMPPAGHDFGIEHVGEHFTEVFEKLQVNDPETIRQVHVLYDCEKGRCAVLMAAYGSEATLQILAGQWSKQLYGEDAKVPVGHEWMIDRPEEMINLHERESDCDTVKP